MIGPTELEYVSRVVSDGWVSSRGPFVERFERRFSRYLGVKEGVATTNGTSSLHLALCTLGIGTGHEVIVPDFTMVACANSVLYTGARPIFADVDPRTWCIDPSEIRRRITPRTKAVMVVHLYGQPARMEEILETAREHDLAVVEDAAEAHGAEYRGKRVGGLGDVGCFSFYSNKIITTGEGGMLTTNRSDLAEKARSLRDLSFGSAVRNYHHSALGFNYRMTNMQAALGLAQLERIAEFVRHRRDCARVYFDQLSQSRKVVLPGEDQGTKNVFWMYTLRVLGGHSARFLLQQNLWKRGIESRVGFWPLHRQGFLRALNGRRRRFPVAERLGLETLSLPSGNGITREMVEFAARATARSLTSGP